MKTQSFEFKRKPDCMVCGQTSENIVLKDLNPLCSTGKSVPIPSITTVEAEQYLNNPDVIILDVREANEWQTGHLPNANHLALSQLTSNSSLIEDLNHDKTYLVYCQGGMRSQIAASYLREKGIENVINLSGGIADWHGEIVKD
jgi:rhodanese-related sulfurtransferase